MRPSDHDHSPDIGTDQGSVSASQRFVGMLGRDMMSYLPSTMIPAFVSLLFVTTFTRVFSPAEFGRYTVVFVTCTIVIHVCGGWVQQSVLRYLPRYRSQGELEPFMSMLSALLLLALAVLTAGLLLLYPLVRSAFPGYLEYYPWGVVMAVAGVGTMVLKTVFQASLQSRSFAYVEIFFALGRFGVALLWVFVVTRSAVGLIVGPAVAHAALVLAMIPWQRLPGTIRRHRNRFRLTLLPGFLSYGVPLIGWMVGVKILEMSDRYVLEYFRGSAEVGVYSANYSIAAMAMWLVSTPMLLAAHPLIVGAWESRERPRIQEIISTFSRCFMLCALPLAVFAGVFARDLGGFLLGEPFRAGYPVVPVVIAGLLAWNFGFYGHKAIKLLERTRLMVVLVTVCALCNIALNIALVPRYGYMGAAWTTLASMSLYPFMVFVVTKRFLPWRVPWASMARTAAAAAAAGAVAGIVVPAMPSLARLVLGFAVGAAVYGAGVAVLGEVRPAELRKVWRLLKGGRP
jgi:O-antigen/teichoic acid export membrane protein